MGTYGNNQMKIDTKAVCFADILEIELKNTTTQDFKDGIEWERDGTAFRFQGTGEKVAWINNPRLNPLEQLCDWCGECSERNFPASVNLAGTWESFIWFYSTDLIDEDKRDEVIMKFADEFYDWCWDNEVFYDDDIATLTFAWDGSLWVDDDEDREPIIGQTINALARDYFDA
jgi:hypothetical protein